jgi:tetratricopeptide (TPR) repeat protein
MLAMTRAPNNLVEYLSSKSEGNPLFVAEYLRSAIAAGSIVRDALGSWIVRELEAPAYDDVPLPSTLRGMISGRLRRLSSASRTLVEAAAAIGREVEEAVLTASANISDEAGADALDDLLNRHILEWGDSGALRFVHERVREVAYEMVEPERLQTMHERIASTIERSYSERPDFPSYWARLGHHFAIAAIPDRAAFYLSRAADRARDMYANEEAVSLYGAAIGQVAQISTYSDHEAARQRASIAVLQERLGDLLAFTSKRPRAREAYNKAFELLPRQELIGRSRVLRKVGKTWATEKRQEDALTCYNAALDELAATAESMSQEARAEWINVHIERVWAYYWLDRVAEMADLLEQLRPFIETDSMPLQQAGFFECQMLLSFRRDRYLVTEKTLAFAAAAVDVCSEGRAPSELPNAQVIFGMALLFHGSLERAAEVLEGALEFAERTGDDVVRVRCLTYLSLRARMLRRVADVAQYTKACLLAAKTSDMQEYAGVARANEAWMSVLSGDPQSAVVHAEEALTAWKGQSFPFQWTALLPLMGARMASGDVAGAARCVEAILSPGQQFLPGAAADSLSHALRCWQAGDGRGAMTFLSLAVRRLEETGHA